MVAQILLLFAICLVGLFDRDSIFPRHGDGGNTVLRAAFYQLVGIGEVNKRVAFGVDNADDMQALE